MTTTIEDPATAWRLKDIAELYLTRKQESRLEAYKIRTLGELSDELVKGVTFHFESVELTGIKSKLEDLLTNERAAVKDPEAIPQATPEPLSLQAQAEAEFDNTPLDAPAFGLHPNILKVLKTFFIDTVGELEDRLTDEREPFAKELAGNLDQNEIDGLPILLDQFRSSIERVYKMIETPETNVDPLQVESFIPPAAQAAIEAAGIQPATAPANQDEELERAKQSIRRRIEREAALEEFDRETVRLVSEAEQECSDLEEQWEELHGKAALKKKEYEASTEELRKLIRERRAERKGEGEPNLFSKPYAEAVHSEYAANNVPADHVVNVSPSTPVPTASTEDPWPNLYQEFPIDLDHWGQFGLSAKNIEKLNAGTLKAGGTNPILVLGDVAKFTTPPAAAPDWNRTLKDIKGFGDAAQSQFDEANVKFWQWWGTPGANGLTGQQQFAKEKGLIDGNATTAGSASPGDPASVEASAGGEPGSVATVEAGGEPGVADSTDAGEIIDAEYTITPEPEEPEAPEAWS